MIFKRYQVEFRTVEQDDIEQLRQWRNSDDIRLMMVDQSEISVEQQKEWFEHLHTQINRYHFALWFRDQLIGYANASLDEPYSASTGLYIGHEKYRGSMLAICVGVGLSEWCFELLSISNIKAQVAPHNQAALRFNESLGYRVVEQNDNWVFLSKTKNEFEQARKGLLPTLSRFV
ncbi:GNAT family N-acetyltransferase [Marinomonas piezotolerans]|uniref:GNAT family N-acetyltransferase n=1 Tax=Marinomonas piezotolerans TaxID=2213058 RepID=UPI0013148CB3|nr:GNAT family N-acetyltransferase [Marinomonas piezotolerans]